MRIKRSLVLSLAMIFSACTMTRGYRRPDMEIPAGWSAPLSDSASADRSAPFWEAFGSEDLDSLVEQALASNLDLQAALQRVEQARAQAKVAGAALLPSVDVSAGASQLREDSGDSSRWQGLGALSYELDLFGRHRGESSAARNRAQASEFDREALRLVVTTDTISLYSQVLALGDRLRIAEQNLVDAEDVLRIIEARFAAGAVSALEVSQQRVAVNGLRAARADLAEQRSTASDALAVLVGKLPQEFETPARELASLRVPEVDLTPPASLLADGRPDIQSAESRLRAANADVAAARAAFFPSLRLGTDANLAATSFANPATLALSMASNVLAPIFSGGRLSGNLQNVNARQRELAAQYRQTVLTAFAEVEDALAALRRSREQADLSTRSVQEAQQAYRISKARFDAGVIDYPTLLETQRSLAQTQDSQVVSTLAQIEVVVQLHKALGS